MQTTQRKKFVRWGAMNLAGVALFAFAPVYAQTTDQPAASGGLGEIIVTAQRRGENLQDVPVSVSAYNSDALERAGISSARDIQNVDPALNLSGQSGSVIPFLRGVGNPSATTIGNEASVPIYIDEVYYTRVSPAYLELANIERVEVLKGPQGTLFGRNSSGGLVHIITKDPSMDRPTLDAKVGYANYETYSGKLYASTPITDNIAADLSVSALNQKKGWGVNRFTGHDTYRQDYVSLRSKVIADITPSTRATLSAHYIHQDSDQFLLIERYKGTGGRTPTVAPYAPSFPNYPNPPVQQPSLADSGGFYDANNDIDAIDRFESWGGSLKLEQDIGFADLVSISAYRKAQESWIVDGDKTVFPHKIYRAPSIDRQFTQELQLKSKDGSAVDWILGAYYLSSKAGYNPITFTGDANQDISFDGVTSAGVTKLELLGIQTVHSYSAYGQATFKVIPESTNITLGGRFTKDEVHGVGGVTAFFPGNFSIPFSTYDDTFYFDKVTYKVAIDHHFTDDIMGYASVSRGYKSGTFNTLPLNADPANPEVVDSYEVGVKSAFLDQKLRVNVAVFQNDIKDPQVQTVIQSSGASFVGLTNAEKARVKGIEVGVDALLAEGLTARFGGTALDPEYTKFTNAPLNVQLFDANGNMIGLDNLITVDGSGWQMAQVPRYRFTAGLNYDMPTEVGKFNFDVNVAYTGKFPWDPDGLVKQGAVALFNANVEFRPQFNENLSIRFWGKNITDKKYYGSELPVAGDGSGHIVLAAPPRTYGVELGYAF